MSQSIIQSYPEAVQFLILRSLKTHKLGSGLHLNRDVRDTACSLSSQYNIKYDEARAMFPKIRDNILAVKRKHHFNQETKTGWGTCYVLKANVIETKNKYAIHKDDIDKVIQEMEEDKKQRQKATRASRKPKRTIKHDLHYENKVLTRSQREVKYKGCSYIDIENCFPTVKENALKEVRYPADRYDTLKIFNKYRNDILDDCPQDRVQTKKDYLSAVFVRRKGISDMMKNDAFYTAFREENRHTGMLLAEIHPAAKEKPQAKWKTRLWYVLSRPVVKYQEEAIKRFGDRIEYFAFDGLVIKDLSTKEYEDFKKWVKSDLNLVLTHKQY